MNRILAALAMTLVAGAVTAGANWWVTGPGAESSVNAYITPRLDADGGLHFENGANATALSSGWSSPESWGVWSQGRRATIAFKIPDGPAADQPRLLLHLRVFLLPRQVTVQHLTIWTGVTRLAAIALTTPDVHLTLPLDGVELPKDPTPTVLRLSMPDAVSPKAVTGSLDNRPLSVGIISLRLERNPVRLRSQRD